MEDLLNSSIVNGMTFAIYGDSGPYPIYMFPTPKKESAFEDEISIEDYKKPLNLNFRDYIQIAIKNLSLLIGDGSILHNVDVSLFKHFGIIPFPDFHSVTLTFFHFIDVTNQELPLATSFSILVNENSRSFLYNHLDRLKDLIIDFFSNFDKEITHSLKPQEEISHYFKDFLRNLIKIEQEPSTIFSAHRKMKILFSGLDDSGKSSFLLSIDQKYSKLIGLKPTYGVKVSAIEALGATIFLWDLGGQASLRQKYLSKAHIYLYEADLIFYFIDIRNESRYEESIEYLKEIKQVLEKFNQKTPIIYILSKSDPDILNSSKIKDQFQILSNYFEKEESPEMFFTSIFDPFSILRAFSSGIAKLSPNRELIEHSLSNFSEGSNAYFGLLMSSDGLIIAEYYTPKASKITDIKKPRELLDVFELTAPQFTMLFKIFSKYRINPQNEATFKVSNSVIVIKKVKIADFFIFILLLVDDEQRKEKINENLPKFLKTTQNLLLRYIA